MRPNPNTTRLDDKVIASDVLATTKMIADTYAKYAIDSATPAVRQTLASLYMEGLSANERVFRLMETRGWYSVSKADQQQVSQLQSKFGGYTGNIQQQYGTQTVTQGIGQYGPGSFTNQRY